MINVKETITRKGVLKGLHIVDEKIIDADGNNLDLVDVLTQVYEDRSFDLSVSSKTEEEIEIDETLDLD